MGMGTNLVRDAVEDGREPAEVLYVEYRTHQLPLLSVLLALWRWRRYTCVVVMRRGVRQEKKTKLFSRKKEN